ncbi:MAG: DNA mismatch repair protein MutS [Lachnospiraceae bacterium]|nr:DNA mismatch repair protein MutS [Lachnospiraceae bacterium]MBR5917895.1 DNA mismatch repair protein MutS [Lachnospiraceae bacterium]
MMQKYLETKEEYKDCILFYRLGDFYEMFFDDALTASKVLEITLTGKNCGLEDRAPMCGVPFHSVEPYITKLIENGYKVAICEQVEDPKLAKGLVKREVTRIVTPGTNIDSMSLDENSNNYLMSVFIYMNNIGFSVCDVTTGDFYLSEISGIKNLYDEIFKYKPAEIICNSQFLNSGLDIEDLKGKIGTQVSCLDDYHFEENNCKKTLLKHFKVHSLIGMGIDDYELGVIAAGSLLMYLNETQMISLNHITTLTPTSNGVYMVIDNATRRNLELTETMRDKQKWGSLLWVLDKTKTAMGARTLRSMTQQPLVNKDMIIERLDAVEYLYNEIIVREEIREDLNPVYDLERLLAKVSYKTLNPKDMIAIKESLRMVPYIKKAIMNCDIPLIRKIFDDIDPLLDIFEKIDKAIEEDPPFSVREGGIIKNGYNEGVDYLRVSKSEGKNWLANLESEEKEKTGIKTLKVKYNKVFGYYLEVSKSFIDMVPADYIRKQTLSNAERYTTEKLKELEDTILNAQDKLCTLEYDLFEEIRVYIEENLLRIQKTAKAMALLDVLCSLAYVAETNRYVRPEINDKGSINIKEGRHPVVEKMVPDNQFIPNDTILDNKKNNISIITGPNMAGKSTYMRQTALIVLMAQLGSFVPAKSASICVCDRIFTRVGASDDLASGQSTFMIEMNEVSNILRNATRDSLLILDEIGRGTSTLDGLSIAWAVIEHIANQKLLGAKTLFATHYHELTELEGKIPNVNNYCIAVQEEGDDIIFLRKIIKGGTDRSYGIQVAKLAGVPDMVIERAKDILSTLSENDIIDKMQDIVTISPNMTKKKQKNYDEVDLGQLTLLDMTSDSDIIKEIEEIDVSNMTPLDGLNTLYRLQCKCKNRIKL